MLRPALAALAVAAALPLAAAAQHRDRPDPTLLAWYPLEGGDATERVTRTPAQASAVRPIEGRDGRPRGAAWFDGSRSYVDAGDRLQPSRFTLSAWIRPDTVDRTQVIVSKLVNLPAHAYRNFELRLEAGGRLFLHVPSGRAWESVTGARAIAAGRWTHVAATYDGQRAQLWVDGVRDGAPLAVAYLQSQTPTFIGARPESGGRDGRTQTGPTFFFAGAIQDVRIHDRALPEGELQAMARDAREAPAPVPPPAPQPRPEPVDVIAWYPLDGDLRDAAGRADALAVGSVRPAEDRKGDPRGAVVFASKDAYVSLGARTEPDRLTIAAWVRPNRIDRDQVIFSKRAGGAAGREKYVELRVEAGGRLVLAVPGGAPGGGRPIVKSSRVLAAGRWTHVAATLDGERGVLYVDGDADADGLVPAWSPTQGAVFLGARPDATGKAARLGTGLDGRLDDVRVYRGALDPTGVEDLFQDRGRPPRRDDRAEAEDEDAPETALLVRVSQLVAQHDDACIRRNGRAVLKVEARALAFVDDAERAARTERNTRLAGYLRRAAQELQTVRGDLDAAGLDRRRAALATLAESVWNDLATDIDERPFGRGDERDGRHGDRDGDRHGGSDWR